MQLTNITKIQAKMLTVNFAVNSSMLLIILASLIYQIRVVLRAKPRIMENFSYAHSPNHLRDLTNCEKDLFPIVKNYAAKLGYQSEYFFQRYIADYEESSLIAFNEWNKTEGKKSIGAHANPLLSYRMIRRFATDLPQIFLFTSRDSEIKKIFQKAIPPSFIWPTEKDLNYSMDTLLDIHNIYDMNLTELANGIISNVVTSASLSAIHCYEISKYALRNNKQFTLALEWLEIADSKRIDANGHRILDYVDATSISQLLQEIIREHDAVWIENPEYSNMYQFVHKMSSKHTWIPQKRILQRQYKSKGDAASHLSVNDVTAFTTLCNGGNLQSEKEKSELYCWYESKINPAWYINPQKMELYSKDPYIFQVYDFVGTELMEYIKREAFPIMKRALVGYPLNDPDVVVEPGTDPMHYTSRERTSMYSWLDPLLHESRLPVLSRRIGYLTGLDTTYRQGAGANSLEIVIYATGGYFGTHIDPPDDDEAGNVWDYLATFMLYLNDVELGARTVFPSIGFSVPPKKGSALFWYNIKHNGKVDYRSYHGGCPVLLGEKWIANSWIRYHRNVFRRKCTLNEDD